MADSVMTELLLISEQSCIPIHDKTLCRRSSQSAPINLSHRRFSAKIGGKSIDVSGPVELFPDNARTRRLGDRFLAFFEQFDHNFPDRKFVLSSVACGTDAVQHRPSRFQVVSQFAQELYGFGFVDTEGKLSGPFGAVCRIQELHFCHAVYLPLDHPGQSADVRPE